MTASGYERDGGVGIECDGDAEGRRGDRCGMRTGSSANVGYFIRERI